MPHDRDKEASLVTDFLILANRVTALEGATGRQGAASLGHLNVHGQSAHQPRENLNGHGPPRATDDSTKQYGPGSRWVDLDEFVSGDKPRFGDVIDIGDPGSSPPNPSTVTISHSPDELSGIGITTAVVVCIGIPDDSDIAGVTWNGDQMTLLVNYYPNETGCQRLAMYYSASSLTHIDEDGEYDVVVTMAAGAGVRFAATVINLLGTSGTPFGTVLTKKVVAGTSIESDEISSKGLVMDTILAGTSASTITTTGIDSVAENGSGDGDANSSPASSHHGVSSLVSNTATLQDPLNVTIGWNHPSNTNWGQITVAIKPSSPGAVYVCTDASPGAATWLKTTVTKWEGEISFGDAMPDGIELIR